MYFVVGWPRQSRLQKRRNLVKLWREYGRDGVTIGKKAWVGVLWGGDYCRPWLGDTWDESAWEFGPLQSL